MKIVHINHSDDIGGAAIAAFRLCTAMCRAGVDSKMLVYRKLRRDDPMVEEVLHSKVSLILHQVRIRIVKILIRLLFKPFGTFSIPITGVKIHNHRLIKEADVIVLHWISSNMMTMRELKKILCLRKPVFWVLHDCYPFTGGCHVPMECNRYTNNCRDCKFVKRLRWYNIAYKELKKKQTVFDYPNLHFIGPSQWIVNCAKNSTLLGSKDVRVCRNIIDTELFKPNDMADKKEKIGLDPSKKTILFIAASAKDVYKGQKYLNDTLRLLPNEKYQCVVLGADAECGDVSISTFCLGYVSDEAKLVEIYNLADVLILPSLAESFSLVVAEAMACGVPCVGFSCTAIPGLITHKVTGYLADYRSSESLVEGIRWICEESEYNSLSMACIDFIEENCSYHQVLKIYSVVTDSVIR